MIELPNDKSRLLQWNRPSTSLSFPPATPFLSRMKDSDKLRSHESGSWGSINKGGRCPFPRGPLSGRSTASTDTKHKAATGGKPYASCCHSSHDISLHLGKMLRLMEMFSLVFLFLVHMKMWTSVHDAAGDRQCP